MGWTYLTRKVDRKDIKEFLIKEFTCDDPKYNTTVIDCSVKNNEAYLAVHDHIRQETTAYVILLSFRNNEIGFKDMHESEGPYYFNCPKRIIKKLSSTNDVTSLAWRSACLNKNGNTDTYSAARQVFC